MITVKAVIRNILKAGYFQLIESLFEQIFLTVRVLSSKLFMHLFKSLENKNRM